MTDKPKLGRPSRDSLTGRLNNILAVASDEFMENGFERTTIDAIARKANAAKRTIYQHFGSKENLLIEMFRVFGDEFNLRLKSLIDDGRSLEEVLTDIGSHISEHFFDIRRQRGLRLLIAESEKFPALSQIMARSATDLRAPMIEYFKKLIERGELEIEDLELATIQFNNLCSLGFHFLIFSEHPLSDPDTRRRIVRGAVEMFIARYRAPGR